MQFKLVFLKNTLPPPRRWRDWSLWSLSVFVRNAKENPPSGEDWTGSRYRAGGRVYPTAVRVPHSASISAKADLIFRAGSRDFMPAAAAAALKFPSLVRRASITR